MAFKLHSTYDLPGSTNFLCMLQISGFRQWQRFSTIIDDHTANSRWPAPIFFALVTIQARCKICVALYKICTCPRRDRHSRAFPVEDVLSACSSHRPSCPPAPCRGGSRSRSALFELLLLLLLVDQVLRTGGVVNDHRLTLALRPLTKFFSFPLLPPTRNARLDYCLFPPARRRCGAKPTSYENCPPTHPTSLPQHHCIVLTFDSWHWHHSILNSIGIINLACPVFTFCKSS